MHMVLVLMRLPRNGSNSVGFKLSIPGTRLVICIVTLREVFCLKAYIYLGHGRSVLRIMFLRDQNVLDASGSSVYNIKFTAGIFVITKSYQPNLLSDQPNKLIDHTAVQSISTYRKKTVGAVH